MHFLPETSTSAPFTGFWSSAVHNKKKIAWNKTVFPDGRVESVHVFTNFVAPSQQFNRVLQVHIDVEVELTRRPRFVGILNKAVEH
jgi:hypothetical protein